MKKILILFLLCSLYSFSQVEKKHATVQARKAFLTDFCKKYNSASVQAIWNSDAKNHFEEFVEGHTEYELIEEYGTIIHELLHYYNKTETGGQYYFIEAGVSIFVPYSKRYNSKELNQFVRKGIQDSVFRYGLYVGGKQYTGIQNGKKVEVNTNGKTEISSIVDGIYGMFEEFCAYYYGCLASYEAEKYYNSVQDKEKDPLFDFAHEVMGDAIAYYEFNLFMAWYLQYAKKKHPEIYAEIHQNKAFKVAYSMVDAKFKSLTEQAAVKCKPHFINLEKEINDAEFQSYMKLKFDESFDDLQEFYKIIALEEPELFVKKQKTIQGKNRTVLEVIDKEEEEFLREEYHELSIEMKDIKSDPELSSLLNSLEFYYALPNLQLEYLKKQFTPEVKEELNKLRIQGVTSSNYNSFIK